MDDSSEDIQNKDVLLDEIARFLFTAM